MTDASWTRSGEMKTMTKIYYNGLGDISNVPDAVIPGLKDKTDKYFVQVMFEAIENQSFREKHQNPTMLCIFLCRYVCRDKDYKKSLNLYYNYYTKGYLASSIRLDELAEAFGYPRIQTPWKHVQYLAKIGALEIKKSKTPSGRYQNVYVMGKEVDCKPVWYFNR